MLGIFLGWFKTKISLRTSDIDTIFRGNQFTSGEMSPSIFLEEYGTIGWKSQADIGASRIQGPEIDDRAACGGYYQVPKALKFVGLLWGGCAVGGRGQQTTS